MNRPEATAPPRLRLSATLGALLLLCAVAIAAAALAPPAGAAAPAQLSAAATPAAVDYPGDAVVAGTLRDDAGALAGASVQLLERPAGSSSWAAVTSVVTSRDGAFRFNVAPSVSTAYRVAFQDDAHEAAQADVMVPVRPRVTVSFPADLWPGDSVVLRGAVAPAHPGSTVVIERRVDGIWQQLLTTELDDSSRFALDWAPDTFGYYALRARLEEHGDHAEAVSAPALVIVNRPNRHGVPMKYAHYIVIVRHEYRLYYYERGALVRRFDVALGRPGYRTPLGLFRIYGKRKPAGGALGACAMFYRRLGGIAIHGTDQPHLIRRPIPRAYSHGCARMLNREVLWLYARTPKGTHVLNLR